MVLAVMVALLPAAAMPTEQGPFDAYMEAPIPPADGFSNPRSRGVDIRAIAAGRVVAIEDDSVVIEHLFYENNERHFILVEGERRGGTSRSDSVKWPVARSDTAT